MDASFPPTVARPSGQPVKMFVVQPGQFQLRSHKNVIVNPVPGPESGQVRPNPGSVPLPTNLVPSINPSGGATDHGQIYTGRPDELGRTGSLEPDMELESTAAQDEPIYTEIKPRAEGEVGSSNFQIDKIPLADEEEGLALNNFGKKKEIEYWQITAKEVVKFRPCTETFIQRE